MAEKIDIVIQKIVTSRSSGDDGQSKSMADVRGETGSSQLQVPDSGSEDSSSEVFEWLRSLKRKNEAEIHQNWIQRVPKTFREIKENMGCFDPLLVSIGTHHHGKPKLEYMQKLKATMTLEFAAHSKKRIQLLYSKVAQKTNLYYFYAYEQEERPYDVDEFTRIMFIDGCFILQFIHCFLQDPNKLEMTRHEVALVIRDLFLLENQIPFLVLRSLLEERFNEEKERMQLIKDFIRRVHSIPAQRETCRKKLKNFLETHIWKGEQKTEETIQFEDYQHAIHLLELLALQFTGEKVQIPAPVHQQTNYLYRYRRATELKRVGITFEPSETTLFWDVKFKPTSFGGVLKLPPIIVDESTKSKLVNLIAYESYQAGSTEGGVTAYVCFMDSLIDNEEDVQELRSKGIILNFLGSDAEVAQIFSQIANNLLPNLRAYAKVKEGIESHYRNTFKLWISSHKQILSLGPAVYFSLLSSMVAALKIVFPTDSNGIQNFKCLCTNFTRSP